MADQTEDTEFVTFHNCGAAAEIGFPLNEMLVILHTIEFDKPDEIQFHSRGRLVGKIVGIGAFVNTDPDRSM